jgi:hypothetical protein
MKKNKRTQYNKKIIIILKRLNKKNHREYVLIKT